MPPRNSLTLCGACVTWNSVILRIWPYGFTSGGSWLILALAAWAWVEWTDSSTMETYLCSCAIEEILDESLSQVLVCLWLWTRPRNVVRYLPKCVEMEGRRWRTRAAREGMHGIITPAVISRSLTEVSVLNEMAQLKPTWRWTEVWHSKCCHSLDWQKFDSAGQECYRHKPYNHLNLVYGWKTAVNVK